MSDELTEPMPPAEMDPAAFAKLAGNWSDDDAEVYGDDFQQGPQQDPKLPAPGVPHEVEKIEPATRLLVRTVTVGRIAPGANQPPVMVLPADPNRKSLTVSISSDVSGAAGSYVLVAIGADGNAVRNGQTLAVGINGAGDITSSRTFDLHEHTGALWAWCPDYNLSGALPVIQAVVTAIAVTV